MMMMMMYKLNSFYLIFHTAVRFSWSTFKSFGVVWPSVLFSFFVGSFGDKFVLDFRHHLIRSENE